jgi:hypothetical protein
MMLLNILLKLWAMIIVYQNEDLNKKKLGPTQIWTGDLSICSRLLYHWAISPETPLENTGFEPVASRMQSGRSTTELIPRLSMIESRQTSLLQRLILDHFIGCGLPLNIMTKVPFIRQKQTLVGHSEDWTRDLWFTRPTHYHCAKWPCYVCILLTLKFIIQN